MMHLRRSAERGHADHGWLKSQHTFSFADYYDEKQMGFGPLRVINEDRIAGGTGFGTHGHRDMEIISYVVEGALQHRDSMGNSGVIRPGEVQRMSAGTGVRHSEHNDSTEKTTHFLQIWILPEKAGIDPSYAQSSFADKFSSEGLVLVASREGRDGSLTLNQDVNMYAAKTEKAGQKTLELGPSRRAWVQVIRGEVQAAEGILKAGDGAGIEGQSTVPLKWASGSEFLVFDLP